MKRIIKIKLLLLSVMILAMQFASAQLNPFIAGTIHPGDSIVIYYDVTINNSCGCTQISNQGMITGSNFASFNTDDPDTGPANDATITVLNMFPLPVSLVQINAQQKNGGIEVSWKIASERNVLKYEVERSTDGRTFTKIGEVVSVNSATLHTYSLLDANPSGGVNFYRLRIVELSALPKYSNVVRVNLSLSSAGIAIYPNPVTERQVNLQLSNLAKGSYQLVFYNAIGQISFIKMIFHEGGSANTTITLPAKLLPGSYLVQFRNAKVLLNQQMIVR